MQLIRVARDLRVDFFRGLALWWIFTDHVPGDLLGEVSLRNFALCDATEVFVLLAGYGAGLAYGREMDQHGWFYAAADVARRAWTLYIAHIFLFVVFSAQVAYSATALNRVDYLDEIHLDALGESPYRALLEALFLRFQPAYLNILPMYIVLLLLLVPGLLLARRPLLLLGVSVAGYIFVRADGFNLPSWTGGGWFFNPLTWQLLFFIGVILAYAPAALRLPTRLMDVLAVIATLAGLVIVWIVWPYQEVIDALPHSLSRLLLSIDKSGLHPLRVASILGLAWLAARFIPPGATWLQSRYAAPFVLIGQHSLPVFCSGIFFAFLGRLAMEADDGPVMQVVVNVLGATALVAVGALAAWFRAKSSERPRNPVRPELQREAEEAADAGAGPGTGPGSGTCATLPATVRADTA